MDFMQSRESLFMNRQKNVEKCPATKSWKCLFWTFLASLFLVLLFISRPFRVLLDVLQHGAHLKLLFGGCQGLRQDRSGMSDWQVISRRDFIPETLQRFSRLSFLSDESGPLDDSKTLPPNKWNKGLKPLITQHKHCSSTC